jgi:hypothetical protein
MQKKIKRYVKQDRGKGDYVIENYDRYDTDEIIIEKGEISDVFWVEPYINWFNYENKIFFICSKNILIEYKKNDMEGIRYLGQTSAFSALENFASEFNLKGALINEILHSKKDGWYTKDKHLKHYIIIRDTQVEFLSKKNISVKEIENHLIRETHIPLKKKLMISKVKLKKEIKYILEFRNKEEIEKFSAILFLKNKKKIKFMGIETYKINNIDFKKIGEIIKFTRIYFLFNEIFKIVIEYDNLDENQYLILKKEYRKDFNKINKNIFFCYTKNSEFYRKCYNESGFFKNIDDFNNVNTGHIYITDDYIIELVVDKSKKIPKIEIINLTTNKEIEQEKIFR